MSARRATRIVAVLGSMVLTLVLTAPPSVAGRTVVTTEETSWGPLFYENIVTGGADPDDALILFTGLTVQQSCEGEDVTATLRIRTKGEPPQAGATIAERFVTRAPFYVYEATGGDAVQFEQHVCETLAGGGAAPDPIATGQGVVKARVDVAFNGAGVPEDAWTVNGAKGTVVTTDGERWAVRGEAELTLSPVFSVDHVSFDILNRR